MKILRVIFPAGILVVGFVYWLLVSADEGANAASIPVDVKPAALHDLIAMADRIVVTQGADKNAKVIFESSKMDDIQAFNESLRPIIPASAFYCLCAATETIYVYQKNKKLVAIEYITPDEIDVDLWGSEAHIANPEKLLQWFDDHDMHNPRAMYKAYYRLAEKLKQKQ